MARVTVEDCVDKVENRFELILVASHRARMISSGSKITVERDNDKSGRGVARNRRNHRVTWRPQGRPHS